MKIYCSEGTSRPVIETLALNFRKRALGPEVIMLSHGAPENDDELTGADLEEGLRIAGDYNYQLEQLQKAIKAFLTLRNHRSAQHFSLIATAAGATDAEEQELAGELYNNEEIDIIPRSDRAKQVAFYTYIVQMLTFFKAVQALNLHLLVPEGIRRANDDAVGLTEILLSNVLRE